LSKELKSKIALFCNVKPEAVIEAADARSIYEVPLLMQEEQLDVIVLKKLNITWFPEPDLTVWKGFLAKLLHPKSTVTIGLIGKYIELQDAYKSILEAFIHAGAINECKVIVQDVHSEFITPENVDEKLEGLDGLLVAPGFGLRGIDGKILAVQYAREKGLPFFGICLGMQMSVIEYARNVLKLSHAHSTEMDADTQDPVIDLMEGQKSVTSKGGTMRLGAYPCKIQKGTLAYEIYGTEYISERHRHRWELNNKYLDALQQAGLKASGTNPETNLVEIVEIPGHPFFIGVQYHPELKSTVENPHPLFVHFVKAAKAFAARKDNLAGESLPNELV
jgi:CTP synthase